MSPKFHIKGVQGPQTETGSTTQYAFETHLTKQPAGLRADVEPKPHKHQLHLNHSRCDVNGDALVDLLESRRALTLKMVPLTARVPWGEFLQGKSRGNSLFFGV